MSFSLWIMEAGNGKARPQAVVLGSACWLDSEENYFQLLFFLSNFLIKGPILNKIKFSHFFK